MINMQLRPPSYHVIKNL
ncbi:Protein of unknown function [Bacillus cereus]|nr:Protein of unknown function [Bacillus cereus]SCN29638.1 Protein of unknown function [Bacillus wiedmannii]